MEKTMTFAFKGKTPQPYNTETALEVSARDFLVGNKNFLAMTEAFAADAEHQTLVVMCDTLDELCAMEKFMY